MELVMKEKRIWKCWEENLQDRSKPTWVLQEKERDRGVRGEMGKSHVFFSIVAVGHVTYILLSISFVQFVLEGTLSLIVTPAWADSFGKLEGLTAIHANVGLTEK